MTDVVRPTYKIRVNGARTIGLSHEKTKGISTHLTRYIKINSKSTLGLNVKLKITKHLEKNTGGNYCNLRLGKDFLARTQKSVIHKRKQLVSRILLELKDTLLSKAMLP